MAKFRASKNERNGIIKLKFVAKKLQKSLLSRNKSPSRSGDNYIDECDQEVSVPKDVKEGHFAVIAVEGEEPKRFVVSLSYLSNPTFLRLLELAAEEYGFDHEGALAIPCRPSELERILDHA